MDESRERVEKATKREKRQKEEQRERNKEKLIEMGSEEKRQ